ncbi:hypothetical protein Gotri_016372 [Gossypium trilobum]|uniref:RNase H type-1 domain-containing protein n=1 Tax=Gossypium trilobum TaxID=34281 RepID=A0A7J9E388_9ROSI|nr:hypothetical protein [Gossypium trilobum]
MIHSGVGIKHPLHCLVSSIGELLQRDWRCELRYVPRQRNFVADHLAKRSLTLEC